MQRPSRENKALGVFAPLVGALVFKTSGRLEQSRQWVRFPYTPVLLVFRSFATLLASAGSLLFHRHWRARGVSPPAEPTTNVGVTPLTPGRSPDRRKTYAA